MIPVGEAIERILAGVAPLEPAPVELLRASGLVLAEPVVSPLDIPAHTNSAMDGYAVRSADVRGAGADTPVRLRVVESVAAGSFPARAVGVGEATRIFTGAPVPEGADGVIRQEDTERDGEFVLVRSDRDAGRNLRQRGEDVRRGELVFAPGTPLGPAQLGVLASMAIARVMVHRRPRVAIIASGDEIADLDERDAILSGAKVASSNSYTLQALIEDARAVPVPLGIARDTPDDIREKLERGCAEADLIVSTAGVSVGEHDFVRDALVSMGAQMDFWRVRMRPGSPLAFAHVRGKPWIGLPGNPVSTMVCFELYVRPAIRRMLGCRALHRRTVEVVLGEEVRTAGRLTHFLRAVLEESGQDLVARLTGPQGSGILTSMARANALLIVPEDVSVVERGGRLRAIPLGADIFGDQPPV